MRTDNIRALIKSKKETLTTIPDTTIESRYVRANMVNDIRMLEAVMRDLENMQQEE